MPDRRREILEAAHALLAEKGEHGRTGLSVREVAARAGIGASTLRHYFPSQGALYEAVVVDAFHAQVSDLRIADATVPAGERLAECLQQFLPPDEEARPQLAAWLAMYAVAAGPEQSGPARSLLTTLIAQGRSRVDAWLALLQEQGALADTGREHLTTLLTSTVDGLCLGLLAPGSTLSLAEARGMLREVVDAVAVRREGGAQPSSG
ncbi:TetR/AcrR family transcriptional regulator [Ornithinicoccus halotolerans]|uniref:TetR/AcrR family transcriptional regulator n=1 Tax=Ornithinicoccus halotolerans TaxID=1748220 RepID=UPI00188645AC|nr:TetR/AcrR family transcriptional regulator [Ornithinicoccus halotolerans]